MKNLKVFEVVLDDTNSPIKVYVPAESKKAAEEYVSGNGDIIMVKESTFIKDINTQTLATTLRENGWGQIEIDIIVRALRAVGLERP